MNLKAANNILREQVMLKERRSNARLWTMTVVFGTQFPAMITTVKTLSSQDLWPRFIFLMPASLPTVRLPKPPAWLIGLVTMQMPMQTVATPKCILFFWWPAQLKHFNSCTAKEMLQESARHVQHRCMHPLVQQRAQGTGLCPAV